ncbi:MAG TPA: cupin domain-containing protein [Streptosporangiaceae bacterium]
MTVLNSADAIVHELHGSRFASYVSPERGSRELCAWRLEVAPGTHGVRHTVNREEVLLMLGGTLQVTVDTSADGTGTAEKAGPGDVIVVPAGASFQVDNPGDEPATAWVTTSVGLQATMADGSRVSPPWVR